MNRKIKAYVDSLFSDYENTAKNRELKEEMTLNLNEKYDDLLQSGMDSDEAFRETISGIGNLEEMMGETHTDTNSVPSMQSGQWMRPAAIFLFITCVVPVLVFDQLNTEIVGIVLMFVMVALGVVLLMMAPSQKRDNDDHGDDTYHVHEDERRGGKFRILNRRESTLLSSLTSIVWLAAIILFLFSPIDLPFSRWLVFVYAYGFTLILGGLVKYLVLSKRQRQGEMISNAVLRRELHHMLNGGIWFVAVILFLSFSDRFSYSWLIFLVAAALTQVTRAFIAYRTDSDE